MTTFGSVEHSKQPEYIYEDLIDDFDPALTDIASFNQIHDRYQFETKFDFDLHTDHPVTPDKNYQVDVYFFIPKNMGIHPETYSNHNFYADLTNYLRIRTPQAFYQKLLQEEFVLPELEKYLSLHLLTQKRQKLSNKVVREIQLFGCFFNSQLKDLHYGMYQVLQKKAEKFFALPRRVEALKHKMEQLKQILDQYRKRYMQGVREQRYLLDEEVKKALLLVDEYNSYRLEAVFISIQRLVTEHPNIYDRVFEILQSEMQYRHANGILVLGDQDKSKEEYYYYRIGLLKKYVSQVLFLEVENVKKEKKYRNIIAAFGAALAAVWAMLADVRTWQTFYQPAMSLKLFTVVMLGTIAYVFKDRIKEWSKDYFNTQLKHRLPDFDMRMFYRYWNPEGSYQKVFLGSSREFMRYLNKENLPEDVDYIRTVGHDIELEPERQESIIHYSKKLRFELKKIRAKFREVRYIKDVMRFDISNFLAKLDEPNKLLYYFDPEKGFNKIKAPKVYHVNVIFRYCVEDIDPQGKKVRQVELERIRLILDKKRLVRIEVPVHRGEMSYEEE